MKSLIKVFKFGGASVRNAGAIRKVSSILQLYRKEKLLVVVSAMGKTTNALELMLAAFRKGEDHQAQLTALRSFHFSVMKELFPAGHSVFEQVENEFKGIEKSLSSEVTPDALYDRIVSRGEIISSVILVQFLQQEGLPVEWIDAGKYIITDETWREGKVNWTLTEKKIGELVPLVESKIIVTQGFIGNTEKGHPVTLGREGSDYSAAIFASCMKADSVTIWKDVPGVMNADPKRIPDAVVFEELPYSEAAEMTYYGASVIHPRTIKPLANRHIPLYVKNFDDPTLPGTIIHETRVDGLPPLIVFKDNQCLVSCRATDYTFIDEQQMSLIFQFLSELNIRINVMQNSAISFSFCIDFREDKTMKLIEKLSKHFDVYYNTGLTLVTIKNYDTATYNHYRSLPGIILDQTSRSTLQIILKN